MNTIRAIIACVLLAFPVLAQLPAGKTVVGSYVLGSPALTTVNALPVVASAGTLGQSDVTLASGIFSRAGALGLATSGANSITLAPGGVTMLTLTSTGGMTFYNPTAVTGVTGPFVVRAGAGQSTNALQTWQNNAGTALASISSAGEVVLHATDSVIRKNTADAADNGSITWTAGGGAGVTRGSYIVSYGNEYTNYAGTLELKAGNPGTGGTHDGSILFGTGGGGIYAMKIASGAAANTFVLNSTGIGFFGVTPVARQTATADAASILALLQAYGLSN